MQEPGDYDINKALTQICIGSDFDGLINPVGCCMKATEYNSLKNDFKDTFMSYAKANKEAVTLPEGFNIEKFTEQLFFENGKNFITSRLQLL